MDRKYNIVIDHIHKLVLNSSHPENIRIPPERELMSTLHVSRSTVREAIIILEHSGFIVNHKSSGRSVSKDYQKIFFKPLNDFMYLFEENNFNQLLEVKAMLVRECVYLAYKKMTEENKSNLQRLFHNFNALCNEEDCFVPKSIELWNNMWEKIYLMSQNEPLINLVESFTAFIGSHDEVIKNGENGILTMKSYCIDVNELHKRILEGILTDNLDISLDTIEQNYVTSQIESLKIKGRIVL